MSCKLFRSAGGSNRARWIQAQVNNLGIAHDIAPAQFKLPSEGKDKGENLAIAPKRTWSAIAAISGAK
jgi:hypothetical protein